MSINSSADYAKSLPSKITIPDFNDKATNLMNSARDGIHDLANDAKQVGEKMSFIGRGFTYIMQNYVTPVSFGMGIICILYYFISVNIFNADTGDDFIITGICFLYLGTCNYCYFNQDTLNRENIEANN
jgi:hypothetical protein